MDMISKLIKRVFLIFFLILIFIFFRKLLLRPKLVGLVIHNENIGAANTYIDKIYSYKLDTVIINPSMDTISYDLDLVDKLDGIIFAGGNDFDPSLYNSNNYSKVNYFNRDQDLADLEILQRSLEKDIPVLGICRGFQLINIYFDGSLYEDIESQYSKDISHKSLDDAFSYHNINIERNSKLHEFLAYKDNYMVNSMHHEGIKDLGHGLEVCARSDDGLIEAFENKTYTYLFAVQWHPELLDSNQDYLTNRIFDDFVEAVNKN